MDHIAIDIGGRQSQICVRSQDGKIVEEKVWPTAKLLDYLCKRSPGRVIVETCAESFHIADLAKQCGHDVRVVHAALAPSLGIGSRRTKNDVRDAQILSDVSTKVELSSVHIPSSDARDLRSQCTARDSLVSARTQLINSVRGFLRTHVVKVRCGEPSTFSIRVAEAMPTMPSYIVQQLAVVDALNEQIRAADKALRKMTREHEVCRRLLSVPGVGPVTAARFLATIDDVKRFDSAAKVQSFLGLVPGEYSSSDHKRRLGITKAGPSAMRRALVQAAWAARNVRRPHPMVDWSRNVESRRQKFVAVVALARKIAGILYAIWRDGSTYDDAHQLKENG